MVAPLCSVILNAGNAFFIIEALHVIKISK